MYKSCNNVEAPSRLLLFSYDLLHSLSSIVCLVDPEAAESDSNGRDMSPPVIAVMDTTVKPKDYTVYEGPITPSRKNTSQVEEFVL
jgi:hypothetical protein